MRAASSECRLRYGPGGAEELDARGLARRDLQARAARWGCRGAVLAGAAEERGRAWDVGRVGPTSDPGAIEAATARCPGAELGRPSPASWGGRRLRATAWWPDKIGVRSSSRRHGVRRSSSHGAQGV
jgi:hypothetical protein